MMTRRHLLAGSAASLAVPFAPLSLRAAGAAEQASRATLLFDAFGAPSGLKRGWGYSAFIEHGGRRILFDTGNNASDKPARLTHLDHRDQGRVHIQRVETPAEIVRTLGFAIRHVGLHRLVVRAAMDTSPRCRPIAS